MVKITAELKIDVIYIIGDKYCNVIRIFMNQLMPGEPMKIFGDGRQTRAFSYIAGVAEIIERSVSEPKAYN